MKFAFIHDERHNDPALVWCRVLDVSRAGYYSWRDRRPCKRVQDDEMLLGHIEQAHRKSKGRYALLASSTSCTTAA